MATSNPSYSGLMHAGAGTTLFLAQLSAVVPGLLPMLILIGAVVAVVLLPIAALGLVVAVLAAPPLAIWRLVARRGAG